MGWFWYLGVGQLREAGREWLERSVVRMALSLYVQYTLYRHSLRRASRLDLDQVLEHIEAISIRLQVPDIITATQRRRPRSIVVAAER